MVMTGKFQRCEEKNPSWARCEKSCDGTDYGVAVAGRRYASKSVVNGCVRAMQIEITNVPKTDRVFICASKRDGK
ncbi:unnamed protein product [Anisakis simplex]|uniref:TSP1_CCN domain-containing protein n=1 Tax=Anisakis simplex TaxID=6269 RepID=A0A0M3J6Z9_ANISI|nr:unnamed protein product [Anisakis simplex]